MRELEYPFDGELILKKAKSIKKTLLSDGSKRLTKKIAVLGGSTTHDIIKILELFLLNHGIEPIFYESEYGQYFQDAMFPGEELAEFTPDIVYIHTGNRNINEYPAMNASEAEVEELLESTLARFRSMWEALRERFGCVIIQNNFEPPYYRLMGNREAVDIHGRQYFLNRLNEGFYRYARENQHFHINDIQYLSSCYGLDKWSDPFYWHMYKYALCLPAIPYLSFNVANMIKAIYGKNKKALVLDLDNTLWGGVVGDDGPENLEIGQETSMGQVYTEFQSYLKQQKDIGVLLNVSSKNEEENALAGLSHPDGVLRPEDFILIKANWEPKSENVAKIASELDILPESLVFVDDNPAEREIVRGQMPGTAVPEMESPEQFIRILDRSGFFEVTALSEDDKQRGEMYKANLERKKQQESFGSYEEYLASLQMVGTIRPFEPLYMARIAQLTNKSNQFNLTTKRYTQAQIEQTAADPAYITLYGKLEDKFGDNGVVSVVIGRKEEDTLHIELWLMSCRVLKRDMEFAMMDVLVHQCLQDGIKKIKGYYYPTAKNKMVEKFYEIQGFTLESWDEEGNTVWNFEPDTSYQDKNKAITLQKI
ncbi:MAG: HAD family hydrolase [Lachnospiraceae bacterium]|nr:HAD family hydrolase [Lachnospiraceae bacterium]